MSAQPAAYSKALPRPSNSLLRRPLQNYFKKHVVIALGVAAVCGIVTKVLVSDPRKRNYKNFYQTWDSDRHLKRMIAAGVFQYEKPENQFPDWIVDYEKEVDKAIAALKK